MGATTVTSGSEAAEYQIADNIVEQEPVGDRIAASFEKASDVVQDTTETQYKPEAEGQTAAPEQIPAFFFVF